WRKRNTSLIGFGKSKVCELISDSADTLTLDVAYTLYNSVLKGFSVANTAAYDDNGNDAVKVANLGGGDPIDLSQVDLDIHIHQASRDGFHVENGFDIDGNFDLKMTSTLGETGIGRYSIYCDAGG